MKSKVFVTAACAIGFIMMFSCKTVYVPVEKEVIRRDSIYRSVVYKDTVIERDTVKIKINGDCVDSIVTKWRERVRWRSRLCENTNKHNVFKIIIFQNSSMNICKLGKKRVTLCQT